MPIRRERKNLAARMWLVSLIFLGTVLAGDARTDDTMNGATSGDTLAVAGHSHDRRRLQTTYSFATQLEMTVCLMNDHSTDSATVTTDQFKTAVMEVLSLTESDYVKVDATVAACVVDDWQRRVSVYNEANGNQSAADVASEQVDYIYVTPGTNEFFTRLSEEINNLDDAFDTSSSDFDLNSLGFLVIWLNSDGEVVSTGSTSDSKDVVNIGGTDVWWPWWAWLIYAGVVVCCICPMLFFFFRWRRDKEAEEEGYPTHTKELAAPAVPPATSSNPPEAYYPASREEYKGGQ